MPKVKTTMPLPSREKGQRSLQPEDTFLWRLLPSWLRPTWYDAEMWRRFVRVQPVAMDCRDTLIASMTSLEWKIEPRESSKRDELKPEIDYYTKFFENNGDFDFIEIIEWLGADYLDIPFGGAVEVGREGDDPDGKVLWLEPLDGGTLFPTLNNDFPYGQSIKTDITKAVFFPRHAINRLYMSPRTEIEKRGWGMAPPEKIFLALELLNRGDKYYAQLLLDTPEAGILDLGDMAKEDATEWLKAFQALMGGIDAFKVPVLYEHNTTVDFIPFGRPPTELLFNQVTTKYAGLAAAGYNMSLSDIGFGTTSTGGETLAGSIRQERKTRRTGFSRFKKKTKYFFDRLLPAELEFKWIDPDDELSVAIGRARLATATAGGLMIDKRVFSPKEWRLQMIADGLVPISIPEDVPEKEFDLLPPPASPFGGGGTAKRPGALGNPVPPSGGGQGEVKSRFESEIDLGIDRMLEGLETRSENFAFLPDADGIADEFADLAAEGMSEEAKAKISEYIKNTIPERFAETYAKVMPYIDLEDEAIMIDKISGEVNNLRYNLQEEFVENTTNILKGLRGNGKTKKIRSRRNGHNE